MTLEEEKRVAGGAIFEVKCGGCGKTIHSAKNSYGNLISLSGMALFNKGYLCDDCQTKLESGSINETDLPTMCKILDVRDATPEEIAGFEKREEEHRLKVRAQIARTGNMYYSSDLDNI